MSGLSFTLQRGSAVLFLLAAACALAFSFWAYRKTMPPLPGRTRITLAALRTGALTLLLFLLFDPLLSLESILRLRPNVVVLVDNSASMTVADAQWEEGSTTRADLAARVLDGSGNWIEKLESRYDVATYSFAGDIALASSEQAPGDVTDIARALEQSMNSEWERGVDAVVLLSDGISTAGKDPVPMVRDLGVPVFTVPIGDPTPTRDLAIQQVLANRVVYVNSRVTVEVSISARGFAGESVPLRIVEDGRVVAEESVSIGERRESRIITLSLPIEREGVHRFVAEIPVQAGESVEENNRFPLTMEALKERVKILVVGDRPGHDFAFFRRVLENDPNVDPVFFLPRKDGRPAALDGKQVGFPYAAGELARYDLVAIAGLPLPLTREWGAVLDQYVRARAGALLFLSFEPLRQAVPESIAELLPVSSGNRRIAYQGEPFTAAISSRKHSVLRGWGERGTTSSRGQELPPLEGISFLGPIKPGATLLASHPQAEVDGGAVAVLAVGTAGKGRVAIANGTGFWNWDFRMWGFGRTNESYQRFWSNLVRWMVSRGGFRNVTVRPENISYMRGEEIVFRGLVMDEALQPVSGARVEVIVNNGQEEPLKFVLAPAGSEPGAYERLIESMPPGDYDYTAAVTKGGSSIGDDSGEFSVSEFSAEFLDTEPNIALLERLAGVSGGRMLDSREAASFSGDLSLEERTREVHSDREVWNHPAMFFVVLLLFSSEWFLRKRRGLS